MNDLLVARAPLALRSLPASIQHLECALPAMFAPSSSPQTLTIMIKRILLCLTITCLAAQAADTVPTETSIRELLAATHVQKMLDQMIPEIDSMMQKSMAQAMSGETISPDAQKLIDESRTNAVAMMKENFSWNKMEPLYIRVYQKSLTQEEVDGMIALYQTPAGQAMINKMPIIMKNSMAEMQRMMGPMMQRLQESQQKLVAEIKAKAKPKS
jgi:hypothetical protein